MLRGRSRALFHLLLLPPALDRPCNLLVLLSHLGEATLPGDVLEGTQSRASVSLHQLMPLKLHLEAPFGFVHLMRHGRLRSVKFLCRRSETAAFNHLDESSA